MCETDTEQEILNLTAQCWNKFIKLEQTHPSDIDDFANAIHDLQKIIALRMCRRSNPEIFPIKKRS